MAVRNKTIEYAFPLSTADVASNTARDFTATTIFIPETTSRTFRSVVLEVFVHDNGNAASLTAVLMGISLGAVARNDATVTQTITNSGESQSFIFTRDVTDYFVTNWTGTSMSAGCRLTMTGVGTRNATAKLIITYEYDDSVTTQVKTVRIPIEGNTGNLTTSLANLGGLANQLPALDTFLPEDSKVYRDIFFEIWTHTGQTAGTTDRALNMRYNGTTTVSATYEGGLASDYPIKRIDKISGSFNTNTAYSIEASTANADTPFPCLSGILYVTYEFNATNTTRVLNSLMMPVVDEDGYTTSGSLNADKYYKTIFASEPSDPNVGIGYTNVHSGVLFSAIDAGAVTFDIRVGDSQTSRTYAHAATVRCGNVFMMRRYDENSAENGSANISQQRNTIPVTYFSTSETAGSQGSNTSAILFVNYISGKSDQGIGAHNHTTVWNSRDYQSTTLATQLIFTSSRTPIIPESNYWITCNGFELKMLTSGGTSGTTATAFQAEQNEDEGSGRGWINYYSSMYNTDSEIGPSIMWNTCKGSFKQAPEDSRVNTTHVLAETSSRRYRFDQLTAIAHLQAQKYLTYGSISESLDVTVNNYLTASNVTVQAYIDDTAYDFAGPVFQGTPNSSGIYTASISFPYGVPIRTTAFELDLSQTTIIRSGVSNASAYGRSFTINMVTQSAAGPTSTYYAY